MNKHILIEKANRYSKPSETPMPENHTFEKQRGYWTSNKTGAAMMSSNDPRKPQSKKADVETGEDQKGE